VSKSCLEPLRQSVQSASPTSVSSHSSNDVPSPEEIKRSDQKKSSTGTHSAKARLLEPPPPTYDEVVSSAESSPRLGRSRPSAAASEHSTDEPETDRHAYEETPESHVSKVTFINFKHT
jgi:hypothetical protein